MAILFSIICFVAGGGVITPDSSYFDLGGFLSFSIFESSMKEYTPISSLSASVRFGYAPSDKFFLYGFSGIKTLSPFDPIPTLNQFGIGMKTSVLDKRRDVNINLDGHVEISPFLRKTRRSSFPNAIFWQISPSMSFKVVHSLIYVGGGYRDFHMKLEDDRILKARKNSTFFIFIGGDYHLNPETYVTVELHSFGQSSIFGGISHRF